MFDVVLESEDGRTLRQMSDSKVLLSEILPSFNEEDFPLLRWIDPHLDTSFNELQMRHMAEELERLRPRASAPNVATALEELLSIVHEGSTGHRHLTFYGE
jgi:hypothetical protein